MRDAVRDQITSKRNFPPSDPCPDIGFDYQGKFMKYPLRLLKSPASLRFEFRIFSQLVFIRHTTHRVDDVCPMLLPVIIIAILTKCGRDVGKCCFCVC